MYNKAILILTFFITVVSILTVSLIFHNRNITYVLLVVFAALQLVLFVWGDKILLLILECRQECTSPQIMNNFNNYFCCMNMRPLKVMITKKSPRNIFFLDSFRNSPSIVIGSELYDILREDEFKTSIYYSLLKVRNKEARYRTITSLIFACLMFPLFFDSRIKNKFLKGVFRIIKFYFYPLIKLKKYFFKKYFEIEREKRQMEEAGYSYHDLHSAKFKIENNKVSLNNTFLQELINSVSIVEHRVTTFGRG